MYIHTYTYMCMYNILIGCNTAARGLTGIYINMYDPEGAQRPRESADISVKPRAHPCYNVYVTFSIVMYCIAHN